MSEENKTADGPAFELRDGKFFRLEDNKEIAHVVCARKEGDKPTIEGLHHTQKQYLPELEALLAVGIAYEEENPNAEKESIAAVIARQVAGKSKEANKATSEVIAEAGDAPRALFSKTLGDRTPEVIDWRRQNWSEEQFKAKYPTL